MEDSHHRANEAATIAIVAAAAAAANQFGQKGYLKFPTPRLGPESCRQLRNDILRQWNAALELPEDQHERFFSAIRRRTHRWDLKLQASSPVRAALKEILQAQHAATHLDLHVLLDTILLRQHPRVVTNSDKDDDNDRNDVVLVELGALISEPGAPAQDWHADTAHTGPDAPDCICCFVTLQDTDKSLGPTELFPETHTSEFHRSAVANFPPKGVMPPYVQPTTAVVGYQHAGEACLMDCRLFHRGAANTAAATVLCHSGKNQNNNKTNQNDTDLVRVVFYWTVRSRTSPPPSGFLFTILDHLKGMSLRNVYGSERHASEQQL